MTEYAKGTTVSPEKSISEIGETIRRFGASSYANGWGEGVVWVAFEFQDRRVRLEVGLPSEDERRFTHTPSRDVKRTPAAAKNEYEAEVRRVYRALLLVIKAKLEAVQSGILEFEVEFLPYLILDGAEQTVAKMLIPRLDDMIESATSDRLQLGRGK